MVAQCRAGAYYVLPKSSEVSVIIRHVILQSAGGELDAGVVFGVVRRGGAGSGTLGV